MQPSNASVAGAPDGIDAVDDEGDSDGLPRRDREILTFERQWWKYAGAKEQAIRELFDMSATRYYQVLNALDRHSRGPGRRPHAGQASATIAREPAASAVGTTPRFRGLERGRALNASQGRLARQQARRLRRERIAGIVLAVVGIAVLVVAVIALRDPKNPSSTRSAGKTSTIRARPRRPPARRRPTPTVPPRAAPRARRHRQFDHQRPTATKPTVAQFKSDFPLVVLNNTTISGLAAEAAQRFEQGGWTVTSYGNLDNAIVSTCAYYDPSVRHAKGAAEELQREYPTIQRVEPKFDGLVDGPVVVVLTPGYSNGPSPSARLCNS